jgi:hypothetical protein
MHTTSRSVVAVARAHPAGVAVPSAVVATAIVLFTFVTSVIVPALSPGLFGVGSPPAIQPGTDQPRHRIQPQPVLTGPPILPSLRSSLGGSAPKLTGRAPQPSSSLPTSAAAPSPGSGLAVSQPSTSSAGVGCAACYAGQASVSAVTGTIAAAGTALQGTVKVLTSGSSVPSATTAPAVVNSAIQAVNSVASSVTSVPTNLTGPLGATGSGIAQTVQAPVSAVTATVAAADSALQSTTKALSTGSGTTSATAAPATAINSAIRAVGATISSVTAAPVQAPVSAVTATVAAAGTTLQGTAHVQGNPSPDSSGQSSSSQPTTGINSTNQAVSAQASPGRPVTSANVGGSVGNAGSGSAAASRTPVSAVRATVAAAGTALQRTAHVQGGPSHSGSGQGSSSQPAARNNLTIPPVNAPAGVS